MKDLHLLFPLLTDFDFVTCTFCLFLYRCRLLLFVFSYIKFAVNVPKDLSRVYINNARERYDFRFNGILGLVAKQDEVYERVAKKAVLATLDGYNSTLFAYGQTGSGKTFTLTGGPERYADRGIIPRAVTTVFAELSKRTQSQSTIHVSYMEIYNQNGHDLLDGAIDDKEAGFVEYDDLPRVRFLEDENGSFQFTNLSAHRATTEEEALSLLFMGDTNRAIRETPMNQASTRSHCIFTLSIETHTPGEDTVRKSKLNLVDLAGSERTKKTGVEGQMFTEATYINGSLHFLEMVIVALQERSIGSDRRHVPYRNSLLTCVLKDSLGGNCHTVMVATASVETEHLDETISTCRFAQRVAMVKNSAVVNEELDPALVIRRLKQEVRELKEELRLLRNEEEDRGPLTEGELDRIRGEVEVFAYDTRRGGNDVDTAPLPSTKSMQHIRAAFESFRGLVVQQNGSQLQAPGKHESNSDSRDRGIGGLSKNGEGVHEKGGTAVPHGSIVIEGERMKKLQLQLQQRDNEIKILVGMLKRRDGEFIVGTRAGSPSKSLQNAAYHQDDNNNDARANHLNTNTTVHMNGAVSSSNGVQIEKRKDDGGLNTIQSEGESVANRNRAFELFRKSYRRNEATEENKALLRRKYAEAKSLGEAVNACRQRIQNLKTYMEQKRIAKAVQGGATEADHLDAEDAKICEDIRHEKGAYRTSFERLKALKNEIEHIQKLLEQSRNKLQDDFEQWYSMMLRQKDPSRNASMENHSPGMRKGDGMTREYMNLNGQNTLHPASSGESDDRPHSGYSSSSRQSPLNYSGHGFGRQARIIQTGNQQADEDIAAFYKARDEVLRAQQQGNSYSAAARIER